MKLDRVDEIQPGSVLLVDSPGFVSSAIRVITGGSVSHVGMFIPAEDGGMNLVEATTLTDTPDIHSRVRSGVAIRDARERIKELLESEAEVRVREPEEPLSEEEVRLLQAVIEPLEGRPYESNYLELLESALDVGERHLPRWLRKVVFRLVRKYLPVVLEPFLGAVLVRLLEGNQNTAQSLEELFCSELVALLLHSVGRLQDSDPVYAEWVPTDFDDGSLEAVLSPSEILE